jgi:hypothetical protein
VTETDAVSVCVDCLGWLIYGPTDPYWEYSEGYCGAVLLEGYWAGIQTDSEGVTLEPYYSSAQCGGCGSGLAGDRTAMWIGPRGEGQ